MTELDVLQFELESFIDGLNDPDTHEEDVQHYERQIELTQNQIDRLCAVV